MSVLASARSWRSGASTSGPSSSALTKWASTSSWLPPLSASTTCASGHVLQMGSALRAPARAAAPWALWASSAASVASYACRLAKPPANPTTVDASMRMKSLGKPQPPRPSTASLPPKVSNSSGHCGLAICVQKPM